MRINSQTVEMTSTQMKTISTNNTSTKNNVEKVESVESMKVEATQVNNGIVESSPGEKYKEKLEKAVQSINEFMEVQNKTSKFVFHEGLDKYFVRLVDSKTEEVIKEIPPERILDAFYEMQKLAGMIVDEKI